MEILNEQQFALVFVAAATNYVEVLSSEKKCLTDNFVEIARTAAQNVDLRWPLPSYDLAKHFELFRLRPQAQASVVGAAQKQYFEHYFSELQPTKMGGIDEN